jgi:hypothetical protein
VLGWLIFQHNGLGNADFDEGVKYRMEIKEFGHGKERELGWNGRKDASQDDDRSRNNFIHLST